MLRGVPPVARVGRARRAAMRALEEWSSRPFFGGGQNPAYRPSGNLCNSKPFRFVLLEHIKNRSLLYL